MERAASILTAEVSAVAIGVYAGTARDLVTAFVSCHSVLREVLGAYQTVSVVTLRYEGGAFRRLAYLADYCDMYVLATW